MSAPEAEEVRETKETSINKLAEVAAYPASVGTFLYTLYHHAREEAFDHLKHTGWMGPKLQSMLEKHKTNANLHPENGFQTIPKFHKEFSNEISERFMEIGVDNPRKLWGLLHHDKQIRVLTEAATISGITLGALLTIANHRQLVEKVNQHDKEKNEGIGIA